MKLEVGMYVRTNEGIGTVQRIYNNKNDCTVRFKKGHVKKWVTIFKASHSLLGDDKEDGIIEVGDYINGIRIDNFTGNRFTGAKAVASNLLENKIGSKCYFFEEKDIETIVTREQFEAMAYKVGE